MRKMKPIIERKRYRQCGPPTRLFLDDFFEIVEAIKSLNLQIGVLVDESVLDHVEEIKTLPFTKPQRVVIFGSRRLERELSELGSYGAETNEIGALTVTLYRGGTFVSCGDESAEYRGVCGRINEILTRRRSWRALFDGRIVGLLLVVFSGTAAFIPNSSFAAQPRSLYNLLFIVGLTIATFRIMHLRLRVLLPYFRQVRMIRLLYPPPLTIRTRAEQRGVREVVVQDRWSHVVKHGITLLIGGVIGYVLHGLADWLKPIGKMP